MAGEISQRPTDDNEVVQIELIFLSSDGETASQKPMPNQYFTEDDDAQYIFTHYNQIKIHPIEPSDAAQVTNSTNLRH